MSNNDSSQGKKCRNGIRSNKETRVNVSEYRVGYGNPPRHTRFKPGQSGNPKGRPRKTETVEEVFLKLARKKMTVSIQGKNKPMSMLETLGLTLFNRAVKGDYKSAALILRALLSFSQTEKDDKLPQLLEEFRQINARRVVERERKPASDDDTPNQPSE